MGSASRMDGPLILGRNTKALYLERWNREKRVLVVEKKFEMDETRVPKKSQSYGGSDGI